MSIYVPALGYKPESILLRTPSAHFPFILFQSVPSFERPHIRQELHGYHIALSFNAVSEGLVVWENTVLLRNAVTPNPCE